MTRYPKGKKRDAIIHAALQVFRQKGISRATIAEIAETADIGKGTVYEYFSSKDELIHQSLLFLLGQIEMILAEISSLETSPSYKLGRMISAFAFLEEGAMAEFKLLCDFWAEAFRQSNCVNQYMLEFKRSYANARRAYATVIEEGIAKQEFRSDIEPDLMAASIIGMLDGLFLQWYLDREKVPYDGAIENFSRCLFNGIRARSE
jgi:AcrR family transcriptional regulator